MITRARVAPPQPPSLRPLRRGRGGTRTGTRACRRAGLLGPRLRQGLEPARVVGAEALGEHRVQHGGVQVHAQLVAQPRLQLDRLVHRDLLRQRHGQHAGGPRIAHELVDDQRLTADRPHPRHARVGGGSAQHRQPVAGGGRVHDRQVVHGALGAPLQLGEVPDLAHRHQLGEAGRGRSQVLEDAAAAQHPRERPGLQLVAKPLLLGALGIHGHAEEARAQLLLVAVLAHLAEHRREALLVPDLAHHHPAAAARGGQPEGRGHRGPAHAALARYEHQALVEEGVHRGQTEGFRSRTCE